MIKRRGELLDLRTGQTEAVGTSAIISRNGRFLFNGEVAHRPPDGRLAAARGSAGLRRLGRIAAIQGSVQPPPDRPGWNRPGRNGRVAHWPGRRCGREHDQGHGLPGTVSPVVVDTITGRQVELGATGWDARISGDGQWVAFEACAGTPARNLCCAAPMRAIARSWQMRRTSHRRLRSPAMPAVVYDIAPESASCVSMRAAAKRNRPSPSALFSLLMDAPVVPGSLVRFYAVNAGDRITVNGREMPILSRPGGLPVVQIPWDLPDQWVKFTMYGGESPFETFTRTYPVSDFFPVGFAPGSPGLNEGQPAYREDWSATTYDSPASPGEIVHIYAAGLAP